MNALTLHCAIILPTRPCLGLILVFISKFIIGLVHIVICVNIRNIDLTIRYTGSGHNGHPQGIYALVPSRLISGTSVFGIISIS